MRLALALGLLLGSSVALAQPAPEATAPGGVRTSEHEWEQREGVWAYAFAESGERPSGRYRRFVGRWRSEGRTATLEVHPDGRFRWVHRPVRDWVACPATGRLSGAPRAPTFWGPDTDVDALVRSRPLDSPSQCVLGRALSFALAPPYGEAPRVFFESADSFVLVYRQMEVEEGRGRVYVATPSGDWQVVRFVREGAEAPTASGSHRLRGDWVVIEGDEVGTLTIDGGSAEEARYRLRIGGRTERGRVRCEDRWCRDVALGDARYRVVNEGHSYRDWRVGDRRVRWVLTDRL